MRLQSLITQGPSHRFLLRDTQTATILRHLGKQGMQIVAVTPGKLTDRLYQHDTEQRGYLRITFYSG